MKYTIKFDDFSELWIMNGQAERFIGEHLLDIAHENNIRDIGISESHLLSILQSEGIEVGILEADGSKSDW